MRLSRHGSEGAAAVEFALVLTILVFLATGITQFGFTFFQYLEVVHSVREGARWASLSPKQVGTVGDTTVVPATVKYKVAASAPGLHPGLTDADITVSVYNATSGTWVQRGASDFIGPPVNANDSGQPVRVTVTYTSPVFFPFISAITGSEELTLTSTAIQRIE